MYSQTPSQTRSIKIPGNPNRANPTSALVQELRPLSVIHFHRDSTFYPHFPALSWEAVSILIGIFLTYNFECYSMFLFQEVLLFHCYSWIICFDSPRPGDTVMFISLHKNVRFILPCVNSDSKLSPPLSLFGIFATIILHDILSYLSDAFPFPLMSVSSPLGYVSDFCQMHFPLVFIRFTSCLANSSFWCHPVHQMFISLLIALPCPPFSDKISRC